MKNLILMLVLLSNIFTSTLLAGELKQGIDLIDQELESLRGKRVALLAHGASVNQLGEHLIDVLNKTNSLNLLFAPEHGLRTDVDDFFTDGIDLQTGIPVVSLYKRERRVPSDEDLAKLDVLVIDLMDVGVRFYTYGATVFLTIKKCLDAGKKVIFLDRINPNANNISGPLLDSKLSGHFISFFSTPMNHGLTLGELIHFSIKDHPNKKFLKIVKVQGWTRTQSWEETDLKWTAPSPALITYSHAQHYSILGAFEAMNISVGRSPYNLQAFKVFAAPWITKAESLKLATSLNNLKLDGIYFSPAQFLIETGDYTGQVGQGFKVEILDYKKLNRYKTLYLTMSVFVKSFKDRVIFNDWAPRYLGSKLYLNFIMSNTPYEIIAPMIIKDELAFESVINHYRFY